MSPILPPATRRGVGHGRKGRPPARAGRLSPACWRLLLILVTLVFPTSAAAQSALPDLSLEDLMKLDAGQVFGASERLQPVIEAPASVSFITADEIARYGYRTLADILRGVRGLYVTNDRNFSLLGIRGFGKPGDYNSRILLLVNGHRVNDNIFGQAEIGAEFGLDVAMFERVEIIRGPASSLYGDSAFFAVINVITRTGASLGGGAVTLEAGTLGTRLVRGSFGHRLANGVDLALSGTYQHSDGVGRLYYPAFDAPATNNGVAEGLDSEGARQIYARLSFKGLAVTGAYGTRRRGVPTAAGGALFNEQTSPFQTTDRHTLLDADYGRAIHGTRVTLRGSFDRFTYDGVYPFASDIAGKPTDAVLDGVVGSRWTADAGVTRALRGRQTVRAGIEFIDNVRQDQSASYLASGEPLLDGRRSSTQQAAYLQDEVRPVSWLILNGGLRFDRYEEFNRVTPRTAVIVMPTSTESFKYLYGRAFRAPNAYELNAFYYGDAVTLLRPESIDTHELVWERYANDSVRTSVSAYWYKAQGLITLAADPAAFTGLTFVNQGEVRAKGLEFEAQVRLPLQSQALVSYAVQEATDQETRSELPNSPRHLLQGRFSIPGKAHRPTFSVDAQHLSSRKLIGGDRVSGATTVNFSVTTPIGRSWELFGSVRNLFDAEYSDPASDKHLQLAIPQNGRTARIGLRWTLWSR